MGGYWVLHVASLKLVFSPLVLSDLRGCRFLGNLVKPSGFGWEVGDNLFHTPHPLCSIEGLWGKAIGLTLCFQVGLGEPVADLPNLFLGDRVNIPEAQKTAMFLRPQSTEGRIWEETT